MEAVVRVFPELAEDARRVLEVLDGLEQGHDVHAVETCLLRRLHQREEIVRAPRHAEDEAVRRGASMLGLQVAYRLQLGGDLFRRRPELRAVVAEIQSRQMEPEDLRLGDQPRDPPLRRPPRTHLLQVPADRGQVLHELRRVSVPASQTVADPAQAPSETFIGLERIPSGRGSLLVRHR